MRQQRRRLAYNWAVGIVLALVALRVLDWLGEVVKP
jgi:hypothetical protein